jgi:uncharacterized membrane protein YhhN
MQSISWGAVYFLLLLADISLIALDVPEARYVSKPLLMIALGCYCWTQAGEVQLRARNLIFVALIFSWWGDVLLLFDEMFVEGLASFLIAHLLYITFFLLVKSRPPLSRKALVFMVLVVVYATGLVWFLSPHLGALKPAVTVYAAALTLMLLTSIRAFGLNGTQAGRLCVSGAVLFVFSDSLLAIEKFYMYFPGSSGLIMLTYGCAQWMIVEGSTRYLKMEA